jgi:hypothetical protein
MAQPWFACYVNDLLGSLSWRCMTPAQRGAYWQLICCQMQADDGMLPGDPGVLSRLAELPLEGDDEIVLSKFPLGDNGKRSNPRAYAEWLKRQDISEKRSNAGAIGGASRKQLPEQLLSKAPSKTEANDHTTTTTTTTTETETPEPPRKRGSQASPAGFEEFWIAYPVNKDKKALARAAWTKLKPDADLQARILGALAWQRNSEKWTKSNGDYIPMAVTYLNQRRWEDERPGGTPATAANPEKRYKSDLEKEAEFQANEKRLWDEAVARGDELPQ